MCAVQAISITSNTIVAAKIAILNLMFAFIREHGAFRLHSFTQQKRQLRDNNTTHTEFCKSRETFFLMPPVAGRLSQQEHELPQAGAHGCSDSANSVKIGGNTRFPPLARFALIVSRQQK
jgi:hypothetical protein